LHYIRKSYSAQRKAFEDTTAIAAGSRLENGQMTIYKYISRLPFCKTAKRQRIAKDRK